MAVDKDTVLALDPGLSDVDDALWTLAFQFQRGLITESAYGDLYEQAAILWVAHWLTAAGKSTTESAAGFVTSERVGEVARTYANPFASSSGGASDAPLAATKWGRMLLELNGQFAGMHVFVA